LLTLDEDASPQRRVELNHFDTLFLPEDTAPLSPLQAQEASASSPTERTLSLSLPSLEDLSQLRIPLTSVLGLGVLLAIVAGVAENAAVLGFSLDTLIATTGIASAITSSYSLIVILFGIIVYSERLTRNQVVGICVFMAGLVLLALIK
jgi:drug/metabolite transporter (DMT)-like permease